MWGLSNRLWKAPGGRMETAATDLAASAVRETAATDRRTIGPGTMHFFALSTESVWREQLAERSAGGARRFDAAAFAMLARRSAS